jgi:hypothetical protein
MICKNCGNIAKGNYCSRCGQKAYFDRLNFSYLFREVTGSVFQLQNGFFFTFIEMFLAPGKSINEYLDGKRKKYFKPISYVLVLSTVYFLVTMAINERTWIGDFLAGWYEGIREKNAVVQMALIWFSENYAYTTLLVLPIFSFASYLSFLKFNKNYIEHIVINSFITGQQAVLYSFFAVVGFIVDNTLLVIAPFVLSVFYNIFVYYKIFNKGNRLMNILRSIATYILSLVFSTGVFILVFLTSKI